MPLRPKSLKNTLLLTIAILVIVSGVLISTVVTHRYSASLMESAVFQARHIAHNLALDAADKILINDLVALQKMLEDQILSHPSVDYLFVVKDGRIITHTFSSGIPVDLISHGASNMNTTAVMNADMVETAIQWLHEEFFKEIDSDVFESDETRS